MPVGKAARYRRAQSLGDLPFRRSCTRRCSADFEKLRKRIHRLKRDNESLRRKLDEAFHSGRISLRISHIDSEVSYSGNREFLVSESRGSKLPPGSNSSRSESNCAASPTSCTP